MMYWVVLSNIVLLGILLSSQASCPNHCNSHGVCDKFGRCTCDDEHQGADCSERICPFGIAWSDAATAADVAHAEAECSNRGLCDRKTARCKCMKGFSGSACERLDCHDACNDKGICYSMKDFAARTRNEESESFTYKTRWDSDKIKGCKCDYPATGYDCSQQLCPNGDDPLTPEQVNEVQLLHCAATAGSFVLFYNGVPSTSIPFTANAVLVRNALLKIPGLTSVKVSFSQAHGTVCQVKPNIVSIEFVDQFGSQYPLVPQYDSTFEASGGTVAIAADGRTTFTDVSGVVFKSVKGTKESELCARRGYCSLGDGLCHCYDTNGDVYGSSDGYGNAGTRGDCGHVVASTITGGVSSCPGALQCSGHGVCDTSTYRCYCSAGWYGGDCGLMECPQGRTWFGYPVADESAHLDYATCSNMGSCDTATGKCKCREGFYGAACEYMACGGPTENPCNGHGRCMTMAELALWADKNGDATEYKYGSDVNNFATWDHDRVHGCRCDEGYSGYDCSLVDCPRGDDAGTYEDATEVQLLQCIANTGNFTLTFRQHTTPYLSYNITAQELQNELNKLHSVKKAAVYFVYDGPPPNGTLNYIKPALPEVPGQPSWGRFFYNSASDTTLFLAHNPDPVDLSGYANASAFCRADGTQVAIVAFRFNHGDLPALIPNTINLGDLTNHNGEPYSGEVNVFTDGSSVLGLQSVQGTTETDVCNNRGLCDTSTGTCRCFELWTSGDGQRQGGPGFEADCGYRNDQLYSNF